MHSRLSYLTCRAIQAARGHPFFSQLAELERSQWFSEEQLRELQLERLRTLLGQAGAHVPYYRDLFRSQRFDPRSLRSLDDLAALPSLTKSQVRRAGSRLVDERLRGRPYSVQTTSGTTGVPIRILGDRRSSGAARTPKVRGLRWHGVEYGMPQAWVWRRFRKPRVQRLEHWIENQLVLPCDGRIDEPMARDFHARCVRFGPRVLFGNPSALVRLAHVFEETGLGGGRLPLRLVLCSGEVVLKGQVAVLRRVFGAPVLAEYGCTEFGILGFPCERGSTHWTAEHAILETRSGSARGSREVVVTGLMNQTMPLVRYELGDEVVLSDRRCGCGRALPVLERVAGRNTRVRLPGHEYVGSIELIGLIDEALSLGAVRQVRFVQESESSLTAQVATQDGRPVAGVEQLIRSGVDRLSRGQLSLRMEWARDLVPEATGKRSIFLSRLGASP